MHEQELGDQYPLAQPELIDVFEQLVSAASLHRQITGRYLQVWGELGELYAQLRYGVKLHQPRTRESDGKLGNDFIEIKTISPEKSKTQVSGKRAGNFNELLIVRITANFEFQACLIDRKALGKGSGKRARLNWSGE